ncbi:MAG: hypothetical protein K9N23_15585 [Akkermansiaceae bacterium]|nr:hypothetical protein [Akkermansiaceae bacterium]
MNKSVLHPNWSVPANCPGCSKEGTLTEHLMPTCQLIRGEEIHCQVPKWVCAHCGAAFMSPAQATAGVRIAVTAYQREHGLLTAEDIQVGRHRLGLRVAELAEEAEIGEATIKRLEAGTTVQRHGTNRLLLNILSDETELPDYQITMDFPDFPTLCLPLPSPWEDDKPWNNPGPWAAQASLGAYAFNPKEFALAV